jgi:Tfp pilus assembly protein PilP
MRLATISRILMPLAVATALATGVLAQEHVNITPGTVRDQLNQTGSSGSGSQAQPQQGPSQAQIKMPKKPAAPAKGPAPSANKAPANAQAGAPAKPAAKAPAKEPAKAPSKAPITPPMKSAAAAPAKAPEKPTEAAKEPAKAVAAAPPAASAEKAPEEKPVVRRDPFDTLLTKARATNAPTENLPPGKAGLVVETLRINGIVHSPGGMIAIVSNAQQRVYFLRDGDKLYDGSVDKIALDSISFHEIGKDAFGKPLERSVTKQLFPSSGEQQ